MKFLQRLLFRFTKKYTLKLTINKNGDINCYASWPKGHGSEPQIQNFIKVLYTLSPIQKEMYEIAILKYGENTGDVTAAMEMVDKVLKAPENVEPSLPEKPLVEPIHFFGILGGSS